jgi:biopolymer transport protein ExbD
MAFSARVESVAIPQINVTPLVDVLLVLLIIFMLTAPVITHKARVDLPQAGIDHRTSTTEPIRLAIHADGSLYWNDIPLSDAQLSTQLFIASQMADQPSLHIEAADGATYESVARVLTDAKANGLSRIDFADSH